MELGHVGVVSQSGGLGTDIIRRGRNRGVQFSALVTAGNCADVTPTEFVEYFFADEETHVIGLYLETAKDGRRLFELLRQNKAAKPVVIAEHAGDFLVPHEHIRNVTGAHRLMHDVEARVGQRREVVHRTFQHANLQSAATGFLRIES